MSFRIVLFVGLICVLLGKCTMQGLTSTQREVLNILLQLGAETMVVERDLYDAAISLIPRGITYVDPFAFTPGSKLVLCVRPKEAKFLLELDSMARRGSLL